MFYQIFLSPQVKRCAIITYKHVMYELPHELPTMPSPHAKMKNLQILAKNSRKTARKIKESPYIHFWPYHQQIRYTPPPKKKKKNKQKQTNKQAKTKI